jgi:hypothetical protein
LSSRRRQRGPEGRTRLTRDSWCRGPFQYVVDASKLGSRRLSRGRSIVTTSPRWIQRPSPHPKTASKRTLPVMFQILSFILFCIWRLILPSPLSGSPGTFNIQTMSLWILLLFLQHALLSFSTVDQYCFPSVPLPTA